LVDFGYTPICENGKEWLDIDYKVCYDNGMMEVLGGVLKMKLRMLVSMMVLISCISCGSLTQFHRDQAKQYTVAIENEKELAREFFEKRWEFYSGALDVAIDIYPNDIPPLVTTIKEKLDSIKVGEELSDRQLGQIWIARAFVLSEIFRQLLDRLIPLVGRLI